jgi:hypothetical protein
MDIDTDESDEDDIKLEPFFADPNDCQGARITHYQVLTVQCKPLNVITVNVIIRLM